LRKGSPRSIGTTSAKILTKVIAGSLISGSIAATASAETVKYTVDETPYIQRAVVQDFIRDVAQRHDLNQHTIAGWFRTIEPQQHIVKAISTPAEHTLTWREYRPIFLGEERIRSGKAFLETHAETLQRAQETYGVPAEIITAIIGVETFYGKHTGKHGALESLATLSFDYPPRSKFFTGERRGSYAAAMGFPQFISSSYRAYAVDFDGNGSRDLINSIDDAIGSVGNYFAKHGWKTGEPIASRWRFDGSKATAVAALERDSLKPRVSVDQVKALGFDALGDKPVSVMQLNGSAEQETWVGYKNFYVITRYNHSRLYAMAVMQLAEELGVEG